jgi:small-conductance mechanosensitive channel
VHKDIIEVLVAKVAVVVVAALVVAYLQKVIFASWVLLSLTGKVELQKDHGGMSIVYQNDVIISTN